MTVPATRAYRRKRDGAKVFCLGASGTSEQDVVTLWRSTFKADTTWRVPLVTFWRNYEPWRAGSDGDPS